MLALRQIMYHSMNNHSYETRTSEWSPEIKLQSGIHILIQAHYLLLESSKRASFRDFSLNKVMFILARINNPNGYANNHSLFTNISALNLT